jgi:hypothetical protein
MNEVHCVFFFLFFSFAWFSETRGGRVGVDSVAHKKGVLGMLSLLLKVSFQVRWRLWTGQWGFWISVSLEGIQWCHSSVFPQMHSTNGGGRWISFCFPENDFSAFVAFQRFFTLLFMMKVMFWHGVVSGTCDSIYYYCNYCCVTFTVLWKSFSIPSDLLCGGVRYGGACAGDLFMVRRICACLGEFFHWCPDYLLLLVPDWGAVFLATVFHSLARPFWRLQCQNLDHTRRALWKCVTCCCPSL